MRKLITLSLLLFLTACGTEPAQYSEPVEGTELELKFQAYIEMCEREPNSPLCTIEEGLESHKPSELNNRWCTMCEEANDKYSWCSQLPCRGGGPKPREVDPEPYVFEPRSEPMRGERVRGNARAYLIMCQRDPESPLCPEE